jgi:hypothetical protein
MVQPRDECDVREDDQERAHSYHCVFQVAEDGDSLMSPSTRLCAGGWVRHGRLPQPKLVFEERVARLPGALGVAREFRITDCVSAILDRLFVVKAVCLSAFSFKKSASDISGEDERVTDETDAGGRSERDTDSERANEHERPCDRNKSQHQCFIDKVRLRIRHPVATEVGLRIAKDWL